jgi:hypothetical protein
MFERIKKLNKIDWLVVDAAGQPLIELQERGSATCLYHSKAQGKVDYAVESGARHITNYGRGIPLNPVHGTPDGILATEHQINALRSYLHYSHGPALRDFCLSATAIIHPPAGYVPGSFTL